MARVLAMCMGAIRVRYMTPQIMHISNLNLNHGAGRTVLWREFVVGVFIDVVASDGDTDAVRKWPVPLHVPLVSID